MSNPFSKLAALKDSLPEGEKVAPTAAPPPIDRRFANKLVVAKSRKGRGGKTVTAIRGLEAHGEQLEAIARELKKALGCGASVEDGEVLVQGEQEKRVAAWLEAQGAKRVVIGT
ncbi:MAG: translation initiation factor [Sandaracinaceae bacterium]|jgi:translation initiation factor 1|nr:translation initiation factor [Sandaracinaceae bacterium]